MSIKLSPKHGVNPSLSVCFWCGEPDGVALMGRIKGDAEAPREAVFSYEPCKDCREKMEAGITFIEASPVTLSDNRPPMKSAGGMEAFPTGRWATVQRDAQFLKDAIEESLLAAILKQGKCFIEPQVFNAWFTQTVEQSTEEDADGAS